MDKIRWLAILVGCFLIFLAPAHASYAGQANFSVTALIPNNQLDKNQTYFDLKTEPGQKQVIRVRVENLADKDITVVPSIINATTTMYGDINYTDPKAKPDKSMQIPLTSVAKIRISSMILKAHASKVLNVHILMPEQKSDGVILGGIHFQEKTAPAKNTSGSAVQIQNQYAYVIGLELNEGKTVQPDLHFNKIKAHVFNNNKVVTVNIQNSEAVIVNDLSVKTQIKADGSNKILQTDQKKNMRMAPNSSFDMPVVWKAADMQPGTYRMKIWATADGKEWSADKTFVIKSGEAAAVNQSTEKTEASSFNYGWIGGVFLIVLVAAIFYWLGRKQRNRK